MAACHRFRNLENARRSLTQHAEILAAIESHNEAGVQKLMVNHIKHFGRMSFHCSRLFLIGLLMLSCESN